MWGRGEARVGGGTPTRAPCKRSTVEGKHLVGRGERETTAKGPEDRKRAGGKKEAAPNQEEVWGRISKRSVGEEGKKGRACAGKDKKNINVSCRKGLGFHAKTLNNARHGAPELVTQEKTTATMVLGKGMKSMTQHDRRGGQKNQWIITFFSSPTKSILSSNVNNWAHAWKGCAKGRGTAKNWETKDQKNELALVRGAAQGLERVMGDGNIHL